MRQCFLSSAGVGEEGGGAGWQPGMGPGRTAIRSGCGGEGGDGLWIQFHPRNRVEPGCRTVFSGLSRVGRWSCIRLSIRWCGLGSLLGRLVNLPASTSVPVEMDPGTLLLGCWETHRRQKSPPLQPDWLLIFPQTFSFLPYSALFSPLDHTSLCLWPSLDFLILEPRMTSTAYGPWTASGLLPDFGNTVFLACGHARSFTYSLWLPCAAVAKLSSCNTDHMAHKA